MKRRFSAMAILALAGLSSTSDAENRPSPDVMVLGYAKPLEADGCSVDPSGTPANDTLVLDTAEAFTLRLALIVENKLSVPIVPLRIDFMFSCDSSVLSPDPGPLFLPSYSLKDPFCFDARPKGVNGFVGRDVGYAGGPPIPPHGTGIVRFDAIPFELGQTIDALLLMAAFGDRCCRASGTSCDASRPDAPGCSELISLLAGTDGVPGLSTTAAFRFRDFARFDGSYWDSVLEQEMMPLPQEGARYPLKMRSVLEVQAADGARLITAEFAFSLSVCRGCGTRTSTSRGPVEVSRCFH